MIGVEDHCSLAMKINTRVALLGWQANPADPVALWRLMLAWVLPGLREPEDEKSPHAPDWRDARGMRYFRFWLRAALWVGVWSAAFNVSTHLLLHGMSRLTIDMAHLAILVAVPAIMWSRRHPIR
jgi:hypothetical protein